MSPPLQSLVPKLDGVVSQRAQLINMAEQLAALQTAFSMMTHNSNRWAVVKIAIMCTCVVFKIPKNSWAEHVDPQA